MTNANGLTLPRWIAAATRGARIDAILMKAYAIAWSLNEDPSDYRAARKLTDAEICSLSDNDAIMARKHGRI